MNMEDSVYSVLDTINDVRGQNNIVEILKGAYPALSRAFLAHIVYFDAEIRQISMSKEVTYVRVKGQAELSKVFSVDEHGYTIQAPLVDISKGVCECRVGHDWISERRYE